MCQGQLALGHDPRAICQVPWVGRGHGSWPWGMAMVLGQCRPWLKAKVKAKGQGHGPWRLPMRHGPLSSAVAMGHGVGPWHGRMSRPWAMSWHVAKGLGHGHGRGPKGHVDGRLWPRVVAISHVRDHGQSYGHGQGHSQGRWPGVGGWHKAENMT